MCNVEAKIAYEAIFNANKLIASGLCASRASCRSRSITIMQSCINKIRKLIDVKRGQSTKLSISTLCQHSICFALSKNKRTNVRTYVRMCSSTHDENALRHFHIIVLLIMIACNVCLMPFGVCPNGNRFVIPIKIHDSFATLLRNARRLISIAELPKRSRFSPSIKKSVYAGHDKD